MGPEAETLGVGVLTWHKFWSKLKTHGYHKIQLRPETGDPAN